MNITKTICVSVPAPKSLSWLPACILDLILDKEVELDVDFEVDYILENDSIGAYEFWGQKCYDRQPDYVVVEGISNVVFDPSDLPATVRWFALAEVTKAIEAEAENLCDDNDLAREIEESLCD